MSNTDYRLLTTDYRKDPTMADPRVAKLAQVLVRYSLKLKPGQLFRINASDVSAPLVRELYREALLAGAHPLTRISIEGLDELFFKYGTDEQLRYIPDFSRQELEQIDATISIIGESNSRT